MRQKVNRSVGCLQKGGHLCEFPEFFRWRGHDQKYVCAGRLLMKGINTLEKFGGFRIRGHLYKAVSYNFVVHIFKGSPYTFLSLPELKSVDQYISTYVEIVKNYI